MGSQRESALSSRIIARLKREFPGSWWVKTSGNNRVGTPDILGCVEGLFVGLEVKVPGRENTLTEIQEENLVRIRRAGGQALMVTGAKTAIAGIEEALATRPAVRPPEPRA